MAYIKQRNTNVRVVNATEPLAEYAAITDYPELFEIIESEPQEEMDGLIYEPAL